MRERKTFPYMDYDIRFLSQEGRREMLQAVSDGDAYIVGGRSAELRGEAGLPRTP
jgi:hypothetical protein